MKTVALTLASEAGKDRVYTVMSERLTRHRWNRGDSGMQGAWYVSGRDESARVRIWGFEEEPGVIHIGVYADDEPSLTVDHGTLVEAALELGQPLSASETLLPLLVQQGHDSVEVEVPLPPRRR